jgi:hypothetical protein
VLTPDEWKLLGGALEQAARSRLELHVHEAANTVLSRMRDRCAEEAGGVRPSVCLSVCPSICPPCPAHHPAC